MTKTYTCNKCKGKRVIESDSEQSVNSIHKENTKCLCGGVFVVDNK